MRFSFSILFICFLSAAVVGQSAVAGSESKPTVEITAEVDRDKVNVGDRIKLDVIVENASGYEVLFPEIPAETGDFSFIRSRPIKFRGREASKKGREYLISIYATGTHVVPPIQVKYRKPGQSKWHILESPQVPVEVKSLLTAKDTDIRDLKGLAAFRGGLFWVIFIVLVVLSAAALWILRFRKPGQTEAGKNERIKSAYEIAYEQLQQLRRMDLPGRGLIKEYYTRLSDIVRHYLENRFSFRAPEMTTEEFMEAIKRSPEMLGEHKELLKDFLFHCDMVKFAKYGPTPLEILDSFRSAERLLEQTRIDEQESDEEAPADPA